MWWFLQVLQPAVDRELNQQAHELVVKLRGALPPSLRLLVALLSRQGKGFPQRQVMLATGCIAAFIAAAAAGGERMQAQALAALLALTVDAGGATACLNNVQHLRGFLNTGQAPRVQLPAVQLIGQLAQQSGSQAVLMGAGFCSALVRVCATTSSEDLLKAIGAALLYLVQQTAGDPTDDLIGDVLRHALQAAEAVPRLAT
ncbi:hypothetical protein WJX72_009586 [[Myrmecia] bisecta]|uniref:Uncharacterized protein n=1 Tax=[Myrmecia] bisecta TaxID=41462 RepID=A0AAW1PU27_9CHLO